MTEETKRTPFSALDGVETMVHLMDLTINHAQGDYRHEPFPHLDSRFFFWLTVEEWQLCYSLSFAWEASGELPGMPITAQFMAVIVRLQEEAGFDFEGVRFDRDGSLYAKKLEILTPGAAYWIVMMHGGLPPSYKEHVSCSVEIAERTESLRRYLPALRAALNKVETDALKVSDPTSEEHEKMIQDRNFRRKAIEALEVKN